MVESYVHTYDGQITILDAGGSPLTASAIGWRQGYAGMERDPETGLLYSRNRYYSPDFGRWISADPSGRWHDEVSVGSGVPWVGNSFRNAVDPFGLLGNSVVVRGQHDVYVRGDPTGQGQAEKTYNSLLSTFSGMVGAGKVNSWGDLVDAVTAGRNCKCDCILKLTIVAHGEPGGSGIKFSKKDGGVLTPGSIAGDPATAKLAACLCPNATVVLLVCHAGTSGGAVPSKMARALASNIVAKDGTVYPGERPTPGAGGWNAYPPR